MTTNLFVHEPTLTLAAQPIAAAELMLLNTVNQNQSTTTMEKSHDHFTNHTGIFQSLKHEASSFKHGLSNFAKHYFNTASWGKTRMEVPVSNKTQTLKKEQNKYFDDFICDIVKQGDGLICDTHSVITEDGFTLQLQRVRDPSAYKEGASAVLLQHGLLSDGVMWVTHQDESLSYKLARQGYDVWIGNNRGGIFARDNSNHDPDLNPKDYYDYSFYELGKFDLPAEMDFILNETGNQKIAYVAHSQGTSQMFSALADQQTSQDGIQIMDKLSVFVALAPVVNLHYNPSSTLQNIAPYWGVLQETVEDLGVYEVRDPYTEKTMINICSYSIIGDVCSVINKYFFTKSPYDDQASWDLLSTLPQSSASIKQFIHYGQILATGVFKKFDYGSDKENIAHYGSAKVPILELDNISKDLPIALFNGKQDAIADPLGVEWLRRKLGDKVVKSVEIDQFQHSSFSIGSNMTYTADVIDLIDKYSSSSNTTTTSIF